MATAGSTIDRGATERWDNLTGNFLYSAVLLLFFQPWQGLKAVQGPPFLFYFLLYCRSTGCCHESRLSEINSGFFLLTLILSSSDSHFISTLTCKRSVLGAAQVSFSSFENIHSSQVDQYAAYLRLSCGESWDLQLQLVKVDSLIYELFSGFSVGGIFYRFCFVLFSCVFKVLITRVFLCAVPPPLWLAMWSRIVLLSCPWLFKRCTFLGWLFFRLSRFLSLSLPYILPCELISVFPPFLPCQTARVHLTESLPCPQEGFLTASCKLHISNW